MTDPILTIAIPTYNGAKHLQETLDSIIPQLDDRIEVVISDNASTDGVETIIQRAQATLPSLRYFRNAENIGGDRNFDLAVERASGTYVWLFSDDDLMVEGAIARVLEVLRQHPDVCAVNVNYAVYNADLSVREQERSLPLHDDVYCRDGNQFLATVGLAPIFLTSNIVRRESWLGGDRSTFIGSNWIQYATLMSFMRGCSGYFIADPLIHLRGGAVRWNIKGQIYKNSVSLSEVLAGLRQWGYDDAIITKTKSSIVKALPNTIFGAKCDGLEVSIELLQRSVRQFGASSRFWLLGLPIMLSPAPLLRAARHAVRARRSAGRGRAGESGQPSLGG
jgi:glycosyltransferase involved in cell wall biosynthesis